MVRNILPTYSPTTPSVSNIIPEKNMIVIIVDVQPGILIEFTSFLIRRMSSPRKPADAMNTPSLLDSCRGTIEKPAMFDHSPSSFFSVYPDSP